MSFPIFESDTFPLIAEKINQILMLSELKLIKTQKVNNIFQAIVPTLSSGKLEISTNILANTTKILSVKFNETTMDVTCHYGMKYYNFDSKKGDIIQLRDLFTEQGYKDVYKYVTKKRVKNLKKEISKLDTAWQKHLDNVIDGYQNDDLSSFYIKKSSIYIDGKNHFSKNQQYSIETISKFTFDEFAPYLNEYGKYLLGETQDITIDYKLNNFPKLYQGKIAGQDVVVLLNIHNDKTVLGIYAYEKYGIGINLEGKISEEKLNLVEKTEDNEENGFIEAMYEEDKITGIWLNKDKSKKYEVMLLRK